MIDYKIVRKRGEKEYHEAMSKGQYPYLPALDDLIREEDMVGEEPLGTMEIPVHMIAGTKTVGRKNAFSCGFMPLLEPGSEFAAKWTNLYDIQVSSGFTDPIKVYEYMNRFYVQEGNKRVSVMKFLDGDSILASVTRIIPPKQDDHDHQLYYEFLDFYRVTRLYGITFTELGSYEKLASILGQNLQDPWPANTITLLKNIFVYFGVLLAEKNKDDHLPISAADALLIYLTVYSVQSLTNRSPSVIRQRMDKLWREFETGIDDEALDMIESPEEAAEGVRSKPNLLWFLNTRSAYSETKPLRIGFVHEKNDQESGWCYSHELGRKTLEKNFDGLVKTEVFMDCKTDEQAREAIDEAIRHGASLIITTSSTLMSESFRSAIHYPHVKFLNCSVNLRHQAVRTFYARMYEAKFIMGAVAASMAENHRVGYRADKPVYGAVANINAFAAGAAMIDPKCKVYLEWSAMEDNNWRARMRENQVEIISGADIKPLASGSREYGVYTHDENGEVVNLARPIWDWGRYYSLIIETVLNGTWEGMSAARRNQAVNYWYGMSAGAIRVKLADTIGLGTRRLVGYMQKGILKEAVHPFDGLLIDQDGNVRQQEGRMSNEDIVEMDWLLDNVVGTLPRFHQLNEPAKSAVNVSGVIK